MSPGFTIIDNDSVIDRLPEIPLPATKVLLTLTRRANVDRVCWPSNETIGKDTGLCVRTVRRAIRELVGLGLLAIDKRPGTLTIYRPLPPDIGCTPLNQVETSDDTTPLTSDERGGGTSDESTPLTSDVPLTRNKNKNHKQEPRTTPKARNKAVTEATLRATGAIALSQSPTPTSGATSQQRRASDALGQSDAAVSKQGLEQSSSLPAADEPSKKIIGQSSTESKRETSKIANRSYDYSSGRKVPGRRGQKFARFDETDLATATWMLSLIQAMNPEFKQRNLKSWANDVRLMREEDARTDQRIREVFTWANANDFWKSNILCPRKLREKFNQLTTRMSQGENHACKRNAIGPGQVYDPNAKKDWQ
ncbi:MAG: helix-turn-helix domain-containing protein [Thermoguttaceae bacterium]